MKKTLLALAIAGAAVSAQADVKLSGHVNYKAGDLSEFQGTDTGTNSKSWTVGTAGTSQSRFRIIADTEANGITYGLRQELGLGGGGSTPGTLDKRVNELWAAGSWGKLRLGQGSEAGDGLSEMDYSGTYLLTGASYDSFEFASGSFNQIDGGRDERLRYDTPKLGGIFELYADYDDNEDFSLGAKVAGSFWKAGLYAENRGTSNDNSDEWGGSVAFIFSGFNVALQAGERDGTASTDKALEYTKIIAGWKNKSHSISVDLGTNKRDPGGSDAERDSETVGLNYVYRPTKGVELYAGYRQLDYGKESLIPTGISKQKPSGFMLGGRVKF